MTLIGSACGDDESGSGHPSDKDADTWPGGGDGGSSSDAGPGIDASGSDAAAMDARAPLDGGLVDASADASLEAERDGGPQTPADAAADSGALALVARGRYLVESVGACADCHTPRRADGSFDLTRSL